MPLTSDPKRPLTLRDISKTSSISKMTVNRVLHNKGNVSTTTRQKVQDATKRLGYIPNKIASTLASSRVNLVAVIIPSLNNMVFPKMLAGISKVLEGTDLQPVVNVTNYLPEKEKKILFKILSWQPSGIIIAGLEHSEASRAMLQQASIPMVKIMDTNGKPIDAYIGISHRRAGHKIAEEIITTSYKKIRFMGTKMPLDHRTHKQFKSFTHTLAKAEIKIADQEFYSSKSALAKKHKMTAKIITRSPDLDFLYYSNNMISAGGLLYLLEQGIAIPNQIGLATFNNVELLDNLPRQLATIDAYHREIKVKAAQIIITRNQELAREDKTTVTLSPKLSPGETLRRS